MLLKEPGLGLSNIVLWAKAVNVKQKSVKLCKAKFTQPGRCVIKVHIFTRNTETLVTS